MSEEKAEQWVESALDLTSIYLTTSNKEDDFSEDSEDSSCLDTLRNRV